MEEPPKERTSWIINDPQVVDLLIRNGFECRRDPLNGAAGWHETNFPDGRDYWHTLTGGCLLRLGTHLVLQGSTEEKAWARKLKSDRYSPYWTGDTP